MGLIKDILEKWIDRVENRAPNPKNPNHINELSSILTEMGMYEIKDELIGNITEADKQFSNPLLNKVITYQNEKGEQKKAPIGNLLRLAADHPGRKAAEAMLPKDGTPERKELNKSLGSEKDGRSVPTANNTKKAGEEPPKAKDGEDGGEQKPEPQPHIMFTKDSDPAMAARMDTEKQTLDKLAKADKPEQSTELEPASSDPNSKAKKFKGESSGKDIQTIPMEGGGQIYGTVHRNRKMVDDIINHIKATIPEEKWKDIVFVGEGGSTNDSGELVFHDEMKYAAPKFKQLGAGIDTFDGDELDVHDDQSKLYKRQMEKTGFNQSQVKAGNWASMIGQGEGTDTMSPNDYLDNEGKKFLQDEAVNAGFPPIENWDEPTDKDIDTLYRLSFPEDYGDKETKINDIQVAFNEIRDESIIEKTKQLQSQGKIPITIAGESHVELVDKMMQKSEKPDSDFQPVEPNDVTKEMPKADSAAFSGQSDIDKLTKQERKEISMKIDELNKMTQDAIEKGEKAPNYNLCQVTVPGTNLYCDNNLGIPREDMPQFKGKPQPGTPAADMPVDKNGEVDTEPLFKQMLADRGVKVLDTEIPSDSLKATQSELVGSKVAGMTKALEQDPNHPKITAPIYVSRDGYVVDGHHRWAAVTSAAIKAGKPTDMKVRVIDMDAKDIIPMANKFAEEQGVAAKKADANQEGPKSDIASVPKVEDEKGTTAKTPSGKKLYSVGGGYYSDRPNGEPKFIRTETIAKKAFFEGDEKAFLLIFEAEFSADVEGGESGRFKEIPEKDRKDAAEDLKDTQPSTDATAQKQRAETKNTNKKNGDEGETILELKPKEIDDILEKYVNAGEKTPDDMRELPSDYAEQDMAEGYSDEEYYSKDSKHSTEVRNEPYKIDDATKKELQNAGFPKKYIKFLERCINTQVKGKKPPVTELIKQGGAGQIQSQFGEVMAMAFMSIRDPQQRRQLADIMNAEIQKSAEEFGGGKQSPIATKDWVESSLTHAEAFDSTMDEKYGKGRWKFEGAAWDIKGDIEALGLDYKNKGFSTDVMLRVQPLDENGKPNGPAKAQKNSLKKDENIFFFNGSINEVNNFVLNYLDEKERKKVRAYESIVTKAGTSNKNVEEKAAALAAAERITGLKGTKAIAALKQMAGDIRDTAFNAAPSNVKEAISKVRNFGAEQTKSAVNLIQNLNTTVENIDDVVNNTKGIDSGDKDFAKFSYKVVKECKDSGTDDITLCIRQKLKAAGEDTADDRVCKVAVMATKVAVAAGDTNAEEALSKHYNLAVEAGNALMEVLPESPELMGGLMQKLADAFPMKTCMDGEEFMCIDGMKVTQKTLQTVFGVSSYDELQKGMKLKRLPNGETILVYGAKTKDGEDIPIGVVGARQKGKGYQGTVGFEISCSDDFALAIAEANSKNGDTSTSNEKARQSIGKRVSGRRAKADKKK